MRLIWFVSTVWLVACDGESSDKTNDETGKTDSGDTDTGAAVDADGDGYDISVDCNDANTEIHPDAIEVCDGTDNDCDGEFDEEASDRVASYTDADGDGFGADGSETLACPGETGFSQVAGDCNDGTSTVHPDAPEYCNSIDDDCDGDIDEFSVDGTWYADGDHDGYGSIDDVVYDCVQPSGYIPTGGDCDDASPLVNPAAFEYCDSADNDCDGTIDDDPLDGTPWYMDADGDGAGDAATADTFCTDPGDRVANGDDCDDTNVAIYPGAPEVCEDGIDNGCDGFDDCSPSGFLIPGDATVHLLGLSEKEFAGSGLFVGDVSGDGKDDLIVGAYGYNPGGASSSGIVYVNVGAFDGSEALSTADATITGGAASDFLGWSVGAGDVDGDGDPDLVAGAYGADDSGSGAGTAYIFAGTPSGDNDVSDATGVVTGDAAGDEAGWAIVGWDGGFSVGAPLNGAGGTGAGAVAIFTGTGGGVFSDGEAVISGEDDGDMVGYALAVGDLNADGAGDLVVGSIGAGVAVFFDANSLSGSFVLSDADAMVSGVDAGDELGVSVATGDVDGDGADDLLAGADFVDDGGTDAGAAYVFLGVAAGTWTAGGADITVTGGVAGDYTGRSVAMVGDVDADGNNEFVVGATSFDGSGSAGAGATYLFYGPVSGSLATTAADATFQGANAYDAMGHRSAGGDLDGDGFADVVSTAMGRDDNGTSSGGAFGWFGSVE